MRTTVAPVEPGRIRLPDWHPRAADGTCPIRVFAIDHPDGVILDDTGGRRELIVGQACCLCSDFERGDVTADNLQDSSWANAGRESMERLVALRADIAHFSHDPRTFVAG